MCLDHIRSLMFDEAPDYSLIRSVFENLRKDIEAVDDFEFDWVTQRERLIAKKEESEELARIQKSIGMNHTLIKLGQQMVKKVAKIEEKERKKMEAAEQEKKSK